MTHAAHINQLTASLATSITGDNREDASSKQWNDQAAKGLRKSGHARTNQFDVQSKLEGLGEKFSVLNRDDLAEALQARLDELQFRLKWMPEMLSLLLELSDRPVEKTKLDDVLALDTRAEGEQPLLTLADLMADDPLGGGDIWDAVERGYHSSGDESSVDGSSDDSTQATSLMGDDVAALARLQIVHRDESDLDDIRASRRDFQERSSQPSISELTLVRETLLMLHGLPTSVYEGDESTTLLSLNERHTLKTVTPLLMKQLLSSCAYVGSRLNVLRRWVGSERDVPYLQTCQASVQELLLNFGRHLATIEQCCVAPRADTVVSMIDIQTQVETLAQPLICLSRIFESSEKQQKSSPFAVIDTLYDETCIAQLSGNTHVFTSLTGVLSAGLRTYLRPVSAWIQTGSLEQRDENFLVMESNINCEFGRFWHDRFATRTTPDRRPSAPSFIHPFVNEMFALGKSRAFLAALSDNHEHVIDRTERGLVGLPAIEASPSADSLLPFSQTLAEVLNSWITETSKDCNPLLCQNLLHDQSLLRTLDGLNTAFCSKDGRRFQAFADTLFWRIDCSTGNWKDRFLLTELVQSTLGSAANVDAENLSIRLSSDSKNNPQDLTTSSMRQLESIILESIFSWPVHNVTCSRTPVTYSKAFIFLLQVYRAKYLLRQKVFDLRSLDSLGAPRLKQLAVALELRQRLLAFVDILYAHVTTTAHIIGNSMRKDIESAEGINKMAAVWAEHERHLGTSLLLASNLKPLREAVIGLLELCEQFADIWDGLVGRKASAKDQEDDVTREDDYEPDLIEDNDECPRVRPTITVLQSEAHKSLSFIAAGLRGVSRAGGNVRLETLAERIEWIVH